MFKQSLCQKGVDVGRSEDLECVDKNQIEVASDLAEFKPKSDFQVKHVQYGPLVPSLIHEQGNFGWIVIQMHFAACIDDHEAFSGERDDERVSVYDGEAIRQRSRKSSIPSYTR